MPITSAILCSNYVLDTSMVLHAFHLHQQNVIRLIPNSLKKNTLQHSLGGQAGAGACKADGKVTGCAKRIAWNKVGQLQGSELQSCELFI